MQKIFEDFCYMEGETKMETKELFDALVKEMKVIFCGLSEEVKQNKEETREMFTSLSEEVKQNKEETKELFNALVEEMGEMEERMNRRFEKVDNTLEQMKHEINACKLDKDTVALLVKKTTELDKRVEILEIKTA